jgi:streptogramin lyase
MGVSPSTRTRTPRLAGRLAAAAVIAALAAGCSGGGGTSAVPSTPSAPQAPGPSAGMASVLFTMKWNGTGTSSFQRAAASQRAPRYVPPTARSVSVTVNGGTPQYLNAPSSTITIDAPVGTDTFTFQTYDEQNGQGNVLSRASVTQNIVSGAANSVSAVLNGVVASVTLSLSNAAPNAGVPATVNVNAAARDADGNTIVGPGDYSVPIHLAVNDPTSSGTLALSTNNLQNPSQTATLTYNGGTLNSGLPGGPTATVVASGTGISTVSTAFTPKPTIYQFSIPTPANKPQWIAAGSDGNMWFTENPGGKVARITPAGVVTEFTIPTANAQPQKIIGASDGNLWFTEFSTTPAPGTSKIAKVTTTGTFTEFFTLFAPPPPDNPLGLVDHGDGNIWYVANGSSRVGYQSINGSTAGETSVPTANSGPFDIATAPDNNLYYTESAVDKIGRVQDLVHAQSEISLTTGTQPESIVRGPDGNLWFTEYGRNNIGRLSPNSFSVTGEFPTLTPNSGPTGITVGQDGALWFTEPGNNNTSADKIGRITTGGTVTEFASPVTGLALQGIATGPDGSLWFCEPGSGANPGRIGKLVY